MEYNEDGINNNTYELLFKDSKNSRDIDEKEEKRKYILSLIEHYTKLREKSIFGSLLKKYLNIKNLDFSKIVYNKETQEYEFEYLGEIYTFNKISNFYGDKKTQKELESGERYGKCHEASIYFSMINKDCYILTGYINNNGGTYLHSVIETQEGKILDWTKNLIMSKEDYLKLTDFKALERISGEEMIEIFIRLPVGDADGKVLTVFGKEVLKDMKKNPDIFGVDEESKKELMKIRNKKESNEER